jgi:hypothetical protein
LKLKLLELIECSVDSLFLGDVAVLSVEGEDTVEVLEVRVLHIVGCLTVLKAYEFWVIDFAENEALIEFRKFHHRINILIGGSLLTRIKVIKGSN